MAAALLRAAGGVLLWPEADAALRQVTYEEYTSLSDRGTALVDGHGYCACGLKLCVAVLQCCIATALSLRTACCHEVKSNQSLAAICHKPL